MLIILLVVLGFLVLFGGPRATPNYDGGAWNLLGAVLFIIAIIWAIRTFA